MNSYPLFYNPKTKATEGYDSRQRAQKEQVAEVKKVVTHVSKRGRVVKHKIRD
jgi:hypothetical protein